MKQTATPYTPRTILATPVATLGTANPPKLPRKNARKCPADEDYSAPHPSTPAHEACAPAELQAAQASPAAAAVINALCKEDVRPWVLTKEAETGKVTLKRHRNPAAPGKPRIKPADAMALDDASFDDKVPLPRVANGKDGFIEKAAILLGKMRPDQSKRLPLQLKFIVQKAIGNAHKSGKGKYSMRMRHDSADTLRVWRLS